MLKKSIHAFFNNDLAEMNSSKSHKLLDFSSLAIWQSIHGLPWQAVFNSLPKLERVMGIEPTHPAWKAGVLPLNYTRTGLPSLDKRKTNPSKRGPSAQGDRLYRITAPARHSGVFEPYVTDAKYGGEGRIRTSVGIASRFTVCPLWPLGYLSVSRTITKKNPFYRAAV